MLNPGVLQSLYNFNGRLVAFFQAPSLVGQCPQHLTSDVLCLPSERVYAGSILRADLREILRTAKESVLGGRGRP